MPRVTALSILNFKIDSAAGSPALSRRNKKVFLRSSGSKSCICTVLSIFFWWQARKVELLVSGTDVYRQNWEQNKHNKYDGGPALSIQSQCYVTQASSTLCRINLKTQLWERKRNKCSASTLEHFRWLFTFKISKYHILRHVEYLGR